LLDRVGTRTGLTIGVAFYSMAAMATSLATGFKSLAMFRFLLGLGESANWPGATKAVSEWFPRKESGWAVALFDSGSSIGGALAPFIVLGVYHYFGSWRPAFLVTGTLGLLWLLLWRASYHPPESHPRITAAEREYIIAGRENAGDTSSAPLPYRTLFRLPQTWGIVIGKALTDPVWFFITDWFAIYLVSRGYRLEESLLAFWVPFLAADLGNFAGGGISSWLIARGWSVGWARKIVVLVGGLGMTLLAPTVWIDSFAVLVACFAISTFCYAAVSTMILNLPADVYPTASVASVSGLSGTGAGIGTITATLLIGTISDRMSFAPIMIGASVVPLLAVVAVLALVRNTPESRGGIVRTI
jgi:ACS family hexuronate transporter-like MFS transporter